MIFEAPRRRLPPRHLADLDEAERIDAVAALGLPPFRAKQLAHQYYGRLIADPQQMTDLPAAVRGQVAEALFPNLLSATREIACDAGQTRKTLWRAIDGTTRAMPLVAGRSFDAGSGARNEIVVSRSLATEIAGPRDPVGLRIRNAVARGKVVGAK